MLVNVYPTVEYCLSFAGADAMELLFAPGISSSMFNDDLLIEMSLSRYPVGADQACTGISTIEYDLSFAAPLGAASS